VYASLAHKSPCAEDEAKPDTLRYPPMCTPDSPYQTRLCQAVRDHVATTSSRPVPSAMVQCQVLDHRVHHTGAYPSP
jgi:hypothetical protein